MLTYLKSVLYLLVFVCLSSCGLSPLYKDDANNLPNVKVSNFEISGNHDQFLGYSIERELRKAIPFISNNATEYSLDVKCDIEISPAILQSDTSIIKHVNVVHFHYELFHISSGKMVTKGTVTTKDSYNAPRSLYSNYVSHQRLLEQLARNASYYLKLRLIQKIKNFGT